MTRWQVYDLGTAERLRPSGHVALRGWRRFRLDDAERGACAAFIGPAGSGERLAARLGGEFHPEGGPVPAEQLTLARPLNTERSGVQSAPASG